MDLKSYARWDEYTRARDEMFEKTHTPWAPEEELAAFFHAGPPVEQAMVESGVNSLKSGLE